MKEAKDGKHGKLKVETQVLLLSPLHLFFMWRALSLFSFFLLLFFFFWMNDDDKLIA
jgi:hypothetical protein